MLLTATEPQPKLAISLLGPIDIRIHGKPVDRLHSRKEPWLLSLLVLRQQREVTRDWLASVLWPENPQSQSLAYLRRTLYLLKQTLGEEAVRLQSPTARTLRLDLSGAFADVIAFDAAAVRSDADSLESAVALYRGSLLEDCEEEWIFQ